MSTASLDAHPRQTPLFTGSVAKVLRSDPAYRSFWLLRMGFTDLPTVWRGLVKYWDGRGFEHDAKRLLADPALRWNERIGPEVSRTASEQPDSEA